MHTSLIIKIGTLIIIVNGGYRDYEEKPVLRG